MQWGLGNLEIYNKLIEFNRVKKSLMFLHFILGNVISIFLFIIHSFILSLYLSVSLSISVCICMCMCVCVNMHTHVYGFTGACVYNLSVLVMVEYRKHM